MKLDLKPKHDGIPMMHESPSLHIAHDQAHQIPESGMAHVKYSVRERHQTNDDKGKPKHSATLSIHSLDVEPKKKHSKRYVEDLEALNDLAADNNNNGTGI